MYGKKVKLRILFLSLLLLSLTLFVFLILKSLDKNIVYFLTPTEIKNLKEIENSKIRVGGMVKEKSIIINAKEITFIITDFKNEISVIYSGAVPNLFNEGKGVIAEGILKDRNFLVANKILAKHDENYMPPKIKESLGEK
jgi:cytochrome c-type biogenesis protein CcmE|tara:strand:- start:842 stop:1261 length:420 start_codon:yes stop_codon:yes gene_type:complete